MPAPTGETSTATEQPPAEAPQQQTAPETTPETNVAPEVAPEAPAVKTFDEDYVRKLRTENANHRSAKTEAEKRAQTAEELLASFRKALDPNAAPDVDPKVIAEKAVAERDAKDAELRALRAERVAERAARKAGADVDALLDSKGFEKALGQLDPSSETFAADVDAAVTAALEANPRLKAATSSAPRSVTDTKSGSTPPGQISRDALQSMSPEEIVKAREDGRLKSILGG